MCKGIAHGEEEEWMIPADSISAKAALAAELTFLNLMFVPYSVMAWGTYIHIPHRGRRGSAVLPPPETLRRW